MLPRVRLVLRSFQLAFFLVSAALFNSTFISARFSLVSAALFNSPFNSGGVFFFILILQGYLILPPPFLALFACVADITRCFFLRESVMSHAAFQYQAV